MRKALLFIALMTVITLSNAYATDTVQNSGQNSTGSAAGEQAIHDFFAQYGLIQTMGFEHFAAQRKTMFTADAKTVVNDTLDGVPSQQTYRGPQGHIQSLVDWFNLYQSGNDFGYDIKGTTSDGRFRVELRGTLTKTVGEKQQVFPDTGYTWHEYFRFNNDGKIDHFQLDLATKN